MMGMPFDMFLIFVWTYRSQKTLYVQKEKEKTVPEQKNSQNWTYGAKKILYVQKEKENAVHEQKSQSKLDLWSEEDTICPKRIEKSKSENLSK